MHYLDIAATTPVYEDVTALISTTLASHFANPSSLYLPGFRAQQLIDEARAGISSTLGCKKTELYFTASGTEANNIALLGAARARKNWGNHIVCTGYEHPGVQKPLEMLAETEGFSLTIIPPAKTGEIDIEAFAKAITPKTVLATAMHINNETGAFIDVAALAILVKNKNNRTVFHVDGVQAFTKTPFSLAGTKIDSYAVSGHKLHAPKGIGALYLRTGLNLLVPFAGGGQEGGVRPGTENTPYIAGFAKAVEIASTQQSKKHDKISLLHTQLLNGLHTLPGAIINSPPGAYKGIVNVSFPGYKSEPMLHHLAAQNVFVSSGSACGRGGKSHTLVAMGLAPSVLDSALRISFDATSSAKDISACLQGLQKGLAKLANTHGKP